MPTADRGRKALREALLAAPTLAAARTLVRAAPRAAGVALAREIAAEFVALARRDLAAARRAVQAARVVAEAEGGALAHGLALRLAGTLAHLRGNARAAQRHMDAAAAAFRAAGAHLDEGDVHRILVEVLVPAGELTLARRAARRAAASYARAGGADARRRAALMQGLGHVHHARDDYRAALDAYTKAGRTFAEAHEPVREAGAIYNAANILASLDRTAEARERYAMARARWDGAGMATLVAQADYALAGIDLLEGALDACLERLAMVRATLVELDDRPGVAHADLEAAEALLRANRAGEAELLAARAADFFRGARQLGPRAEALGLLAGAALRLGRPGRARVLFGKAREAYGRLDNRPRGALMATGAAQALLAAGTRPALARRESLRSAEDLARRGARARAAGALCVAAAAALAEGDLAAARRIADRALAGARARGEARAELAALLLLARVARRRGAPGPEYRLLRRAEHVVDRMRLGVTSEQSRLAFSLDKSEVFEALVLNRLERGTAAAQREALEFAEKGKARLLAERLAAGRFEQAIGRGSAARRALARLERLDRQLAVVEARLEPPEGPAGLRSRREALQISLAERRAVELARIARIDPQAATLLGVALPGLGAAIEELPHDRTILEYTVAGGYFHLFVITRGEVRVMPAIARVDDVTHGLDRLRFQLGKGALGDAHVQRFGDFVERACRLHFAALHRQLLAPLGGELDGRDVVIVPHGALHGLPFHALERDGVPLVERATVSYAPSFAVLALLAQAPATRGTHGPPRVLGIADDHAPAIEREIHEVVRQLPGAEVHRGAAARRSALAAGDRRPSVLHVASHGVYTESGALTGALKLGDAWLSLQDIYALPGAADLVVLSGCETGKGTVHSGDEWVGLVRGFIQAGARAVVASLWEVHDESAVNVMRDFYRGLAGGLPVGGALAAAQREARRRDPSPLRWAPFALVGDAGWTLPKADEGCHSCA